MLTENLEYSVEGVRFLGYLAVEQDRIGRRPGILIAHDGFGLGNPAKRVARRLAALGYVAFVADYHGDQRLLEREVALERLQAFMEDPVPIRAIMTEALHMLSNRPWTDPHRLAAIGYCYGGAAALELGRSGADLRAIVAFHGALKTARPEDATQIKATVLVCAGADDVFCPREERQAYEEEMRNAGNVDWQLHLYGGTGHSFTDPDSPPGRIGVGYSESSDRRAWRSMLALFDETLGNA